MNEQLPCVGVVIPCFNAAATLEKTVRSALEQDGVKLEIVIVDDGSTDDLLEIARSFEGRARVITGPNRGACAARNAGLEHMRSEYVLFLDLDDYTEPGSLKAWADRAAETDADVVLGPFSYEGNGHRWRGQPPQMPASPRSVIRQWLEGWFTPPCAVLWRRSFVVSVGAWNPAAHLSRIDDAELIIRALLNDARLAVTGEGLGVYVQHNSAHRISARRGHAVLSCELSLFRSLWETAQARGHQDLQPSFAHAFYRVAYMAYASGISDLGKDALSMARTLGLRGHIGSAIHRNLSSIFGLRGKLLLSGTVKGRIALAGQR